MENLPDLEHFKPLVSIIMNCFNGDKFLAIAVRSVIAQTYSNWELIFWDNHSTDSSKEIICSFSDTRIKYFYAPDHTVLYQARNLAIEKSTGELIAFLDVDDSWTPDKLEVQVSLFSDSSIGFICSNYWISRETNLSIFKVYLAHKLLPKICNTDQLLRSYFVGLLTLVVRKSLFLRVGGFNSKYNLIGDFDFVLRSSLQSSFYFISSPLATYRIHQSNLSKHSRSRWASEFAVWVSATSSEPLISSSPCFAHFNNFLSYNECVTLIINSKRFKAFSLWLNMPICLFKLRGLAALLLPRFFYKYLGYF